MTAIWTTRISENKWRRVRRELEDNGLILPFTAGVAQNRKTGYMMMNRYDRDNSQLEIKITYPGYHRLGELTQLESFLQRLFESNTLQMNGNGEYR